MVTSAVYRRWIEISEVGCFPVLQCQAVHKCLQGEGLADCDPAFQCAEEELQLTGRHIALQKLGHESIGPVTEFRTF